MTVTCPSCGAADQEVGKYCENCGFFIASADTQASAPMLGANTPDTAAPVPAITPTSGVISPSGAAGPAGSAQFAVVQNGAANPAEGFTITRAGEYLVGRSDTETGSQADIDLRQWVQPLDIHGQKQYLVHRKQCYIGLTADGKVTIRQCQGAELDTLVKLANSKVFTPIFTFGTLRNPRPDDSYELEPGDQVFMGDPETVPLFQAGDPTARGSYLVIELLPRS
ncbi:MAG: hypothetical protein ABI670_05750 [Chloroflexota bacterium]